MEKTNHNGSFDMKKKIWVDLINPSHPLFFRPLINELKDKYCINITLRERGETTKLAKQFGIKGKIIGKDYEHPIKKSLSIFFRTIKLSYILTKFDCAISFENPMSVAISKLRGRKSILLLDNDIKYQIKGNKTQNIESKIKSKADYIVVPKVCEAGFKHYFDENKIFTYTGYKEDFYIADYKPDKDIKKMIPFDRFVIIRSEAMYSFYVDGTKSLVSELFKKFKDAGIHIVYLPRDKSDIRVEGDKNIFVPDEPINGLDLINLSDAVLTGSGTMAREAAIMGKPAVSFFPNKTLLSVDQQLINEKKMFHSRDSEKIVEYCISKIKNKQNNTTYQNKSKEVKKEILEIITKLIQ